MEIDPMWMKTKIIEGLIEALKDKDKDVRENAKEALKKIKAKKS